MVRPISIIQSLKNYGEAGQDGVDAGAWSIVTLEDTWILKINIMILI